MTGAARAPEGRGPEAAAHASVPRTAAPGVVRPRRAARLVWAAAVALLVGAGLWLRFHDVTEQVFGGDEHHALRVARDLGLAEIFTYYGRAENSIALSMWARVLMQTVGMTEFNFRLPAFLSGIAVLLAPLLFRRSLGRAGVALSIALVATSPCAIYYSFVGRPYGPAAALLVVAVWAWRRWHGYASRGRLALFVATAALAVFMHMLCLLPVGVLVLLTWLDARRRGGAAPRRALVMTLVLLAAGLALYGPGLPGLIEYRVLDSTRPGVGTPGLAWDAYVRIAGEHPGTALVLLGLAALGSVRLLRRDRLLGAALVAAFPAIVAGMFITQIYPAHHAWTRYMFLGWPPFVMTAGLGAAVALAAARRAVQRRPLGAVVCVAFALAALAVRADFAHVEETAAQAALPWLLAALLLVAGAAGLVARARHGHGGRARTPPLRGMPALGALAALLVAAGTVVWTPVPIMRFGPDSYRARRASIQITTDAAQRSWLSAVSPVFAQMAQAPDAGQIVLAWPYRVPTKFWRAFAAQQAVHGRRVVAVHARTVRDLHEDGVHFANLTDLGHATELVDAGARYLVLYLDLLESADGIEPEDAVDPEYFATLGPILEKRHGAPVYVDDQVMVYDMWTRRRPRGMGPPASAIGASAAGGTAAAPRPPAGGPDEQQRAFDFLAGRWEMTWSRFDERGELLASGTSLTRARTMAGGPALIDEWIDEGVLTIHTCDPTDGLWRLYRTSRAAPGRMEVWQGRFRDGTGTFLGRDRDGDHGALRIVVTDVRADGFRWELQRVPEDGGEPELVEVREFSRREE